ncbi:hypothetical protein HDF16_001589 [Granulicella aggregans]|uniref:Uncharacterized protein n=1 Tax=Granulicella aggregans TaxID=474949 RepID=A0A7W7ZBK3_9BACT|nr:hypothetical protein [Granulicella aggregans]MBB5056904.1 hypothetical protein [Granulicella aggregans]
MNQRRAVALLLVQLALVLSVAGKFVYERKTRPRIWARAAQYDPSTPLRGRYLALQLAVDACGLPRDKAHYTEGGTVFSTDGTMTGRRGPGTWKWRVTLAVENGHLVPRLADHPRTPDGIETLTMQEDRSCESVNLQSNEDFFISDRARNPFPLKKGDELWVEVTVPAIGSPRPIQLALAGADGFHPLKMN